MTSVFELHPQLAADCEVVADLPLCRALLSKDSLYPWLILVPRRAGVREIFELTSADQQQLMRESNALSKAMAEFFNADKMNVAALGNMVPQLHIHHIVRYRTDSAWPKPVWGVAETQPYDQNTLNAMLESIKKLLAGLDV